MRLSPVLEKLSLAEAALLLASFRLVGVIAVGDRYLVAVMVQQTTKTRFKDESTQGHRGGVLHHKYDSLCGTDIAMSYIGFLCTYISSESDFSYII